MDETLTGEHHLMTAAAVRRRKTVTTCDTGSSTLEPLLTASFLDRRLFLDRSGLLKRPATGYHEGSDWSALAIYPIA